MRFIKPDTKIDFIGKKKIAFSLSIACMAISLLSLIVHNGPKLGIDFAGGTLIQIKSKTAARIDDIKSGLETVGLGKSSVQQFGEHIHNEFLVRTDLLYENADTFATEIKKALETATGGEVEIRRVEMVGPQVREDLRE